jgi:CDGSH iron-sulfur domain-containing protein 3
VASRSFARRHAPCLTSMFALRTPRMADVKITVKPNGPLFIEGPLDIVGPDGQPIVPDPAKKAVALCRCGRSARKPFCDGAHNRSGWKQDDVYEAPTVELK